MPVAPETNRTRAANRRVADFRPSVPHLSSFIFSICSWRRMRCDESSEGHNLLPRGNTRDDRIACIWRGIAWRVSENTFLCGPISLHGTLTEPPPPDEGAPVACRWLPGDSHSNSDPCKRGFL